LQINLKPKFINMKKQLQNKLTKYSTAAGAAVLAVGSTQAQIIYTDVNPDFVHAGGNVQVGLDLNNDATADFVIASIDTTVSGTLIETTLCAPLVTGNEVAGISPSGYDYALALNSGTAISSTTTWIAGTCTMAYRVNGATPYAEQWNGVTDKYLGLKFLVGTATHYGWARLDCSGDTWTLKDYAYESTANAAINAGAMPGTASIETLDLESLVHFINQPNNSILVRINAPLTNGEIKVVSMSGQIVSSINITSDAETIDMSGLSAGIYMINVISAEGTITKKMVVR
jgi:hypothetical protein